MKIIRILKIKNYHNGGGDLTLNLESYKIERIKNQTMLTVSRWPDQYSSRFATIANFNRERALNYGFTQMVLKVDTFSDNGEFISQKFIVFTSAIIAHFVPRDSYELIIFAFNEKSELCLGQC